ncbi:hypothetical protein E3O06_11500 [Cryobacterium glaciale]|uniref:FtsK domain-containing protein n=1 Tax=Cryobacterium glaciale TaxID=1259145 RepID=A0A4R8UTZ0_9MICO|nr:FtsK/SpoIIIE domain-containing protein [Cryobacterium glaciale]TFB71879.1 hypothetical protein E3O06_11500 [Cryobacterium glaciale]
MTDSPLTALRDTVASFAAAQARALGSIDAAQSQVGPHREATVKTAGVAHNKAIAIARNRAAQQVTEQSLAARDHALQLTPHPDTAIAVADYVSIGTLTLAGESSGINSEVKAPFLLPLIGRSNVVITAASGRAGPIVQEIVWQAMSKTAPAQLDVVGYDPLLAGTLAPFAGMKAAGDGYFSVVNRPAAIETVIDRVGTDIQRVNDVMRGASDSLLDFRRAAGAPVERLQLIVLLDYPEGISEDSHKRLLAYLKVGPAAGVSFVIADGDSAKPGWYRPDAFDAFATTIAARADGVRWVKHPLFGAVITPRTTASLAASVDAHATAVRDSSSVKVAFSSVQPAATQWTESSANGLTFAIGVAGQRTTEIVLGDERQQRHNLLVTGAIGQGKSNLLKVIIHSLSERYSPHELELYLLDFKEGVTLYPFAPTPGSLDYLPQARVLGLESDREFGVAVLRYLEGEFSRRAKQFRAYGDNIAKYRAAVPDARMPRIVVIVDEFHRLFDPAGTLADAAASLLEAIARRGRSYGVHVILASQTVSGIAALMTRENGIFSQFPIRIALKNSLAESYSTLGQGNDGAFTLRAPGQAIVNMDYGALDSNQLVVIAAGDDGELDRRRIDWFTRAKNTTDAPLVFDGAAHLTPAAGIAAIGRLRSRAAALGVAPAALVGLPIALGVDFISISLGAEPGRNIAVLGAGEDTSQLDDGDAPANNAIGVLQAAALSLALQHPSGNAVFVSVDLLDDATARRNNLPRWYTLMERLGFAVRVVGRADLPGYLMEAAELVAAGPSPVTTYIIGFALDRASNLETPDAFANTPIDHLRAILKDGPTASVHVIGWWANAGTYKTHLGYLSDGWIATQLLLRLDQSSVQDLLGPFVEWTVRDNRALLSDSTQLAEPTVVVPFVPLGDRDSALFTNADWDAP